MSKRKWITPFKKQCFVTLGVSLNVLQHGLSVGFPSILLPQLREAGSIIPIDDSSGSWIASITAITLIPGSLVVPILMSKFGRKITNIISIVTMLLSWLAVSVSDSLSVLLLARCLQGFSMGIGNSLAPVFIGEYTSPANRGAFLTTLSLALTAGVLISHTLGSFLSWQMTALICAIVSFVDTLIILYSPESPSWLIQNQKYEKGKQGFRWLRGEGEEEELKKMIEADILLKNTATDSKEENLCSKIQGGITYYKTVVVKPEFYKPIIIMMHVYAISTWCGTNLMSTYAVDVFHKVLGPDINVALLLVTLGAQRMVTNTCALFFVRRFRRKTVFLAAVSLNVLLYYAIGAYNYAKTNNLLPFDHPAIGISLIHIHLFTGAIGCVPLAYVIAGELFPLEYRGLCGCISSLFLSLNFFVAVKIVPQSFSAIGLSGTYILYGSVVAYCLIVSMIYLPETKDKTLQEIENGFRGNTLTLEDIKSTESLTSVK